MTTLLYLDITTGTKCRRSIHSQSNPYLNKCSPNTLLQRDQYIYILYYSQSIIGSQCVAQTAICSYIKVCVHCHKTISIYKMYYLSYNYSINYYLLYIVHVNVNLHLHLTVFFWLVNTKKTVQSYGSAAAYIQAWIYIQQGFFFPCNIVV